MFQKNSKYIISENTFSIQRLPPPYVQEPVVRASGRINIALYTSPLNRSEELGLIT